MVSYSAPVYNETLRLPFWQGTRQSLYGPRLCDILKEGYDIGLDKYFIDETIRAQLNTRIINHFFTREIGQETVELFIFTLNRLADENSSVWQKAFDLAKLEIDGDTDMMTDSEARSDATDSGTSSNTGTEATTNTSSTKGTSLNSNFPQVMFTSPESDIYANSGGTSGADVTASSNGGSDSNSQSSNTAHAEDTAHTRTHGRSGRTLASLFSELLETNINPLQFVFNSLEPAFMQLFSERSNFS